MRGKISAGTRRRIGALVTATAVAATVVLSGGEPAFASAASYSVAYVHANGAGATGAAAKGGFTWFNRSVALNNTQIYCAAHHNCKVRYSGYQAGTLIDYVESGYDNTIGTTGDWIPNGSVTLDASDTPGGITEVYVTVTDITHSGTAQGVYKR